MIYVKSKRNIIEMQRILKRDVIGDLKNVVKDKQATKIKFDDGQYMVDVSTASLVLCALDSISNKRNKTKFSELISTYRGMMLIISLVKINRNRL